MTRSYDAEVMRKAFAPHDRYHDESMDYDAWVNNHNNVMCVMENGDIGLATFEFPGFYNVHWFFNQTRGKEAIKLAKEMLHYLFTTTDAQVVRGLTPIDVKPARFLAKYIGMKSYGTVTVKEDDGPNKGVCELMIMTKDEFYKGNKQ